MERRLDKKSFILQTPHLEIRRRPTQSFPLHAHEYYELEVILEGEGEQWINGRHYKLSRGSAYLLTPSDFHEVKIHKKILAWNISFDETLLTRQLKCVCRSLSESELERIDMAATLLRKEVDADGYVAPITEYILTNVMRFDGNDEDMQPIELALRFIDNHFREAPSLSDVATVACLCPVYFGSLFKKTTGRTYIEYLNDKKLQCAKMLLERGMNVTEACFASGFGSLSGFLYTFKKAENITPSEYKEMQRK